MSSYFSVPLLSYYPFIFPSPSYSDRQGFLQGCHSTERMDGVPTKRDELHLHTSQVLSGWCMFAGTVVMCICTQRHPMSPLELPLARVTGLFSLVHHLGVNVLSRGTFFPHFYKEMIFNSLLGDLKTLQGTPRFNKLLKLPAYYCPVFCFAALESTPSNPFRTLLSMKTAHSGQRD